MASTDRDSFRIVPYRFLINGLETDICKLEKLTNLFPDMKAVIELGMLIQSFRITKIMFVFFFFAKNYSNLIIYHV
jgi:hypothetical protein